MDKLVAFMHERLSLDYRAIYECSVYKHTEDKIQVRVLSDKFPDSGVLDIPLYNMPLGLDFTIPAGTLCLLAFQEADPSRPYVYGFRKTVGARLDAVCVTADLLKVGAQASEALAKADEVITQLNAILDLLLTAAPQSAVGPVPLITDVAGTNSFGAGGIGAVVASMKARLPQIKSTKVLTDG